MDAPGQSPVITISNRSYSIRWSILSEYVLSDMGLTMADAMKVLLTDSPKRVAVAGKLFSAMVAEDFIKLGQPVPTPEQWMAQMDAMTWRKVCDAMLDLIKKLLLPSQDVKLRETAATKVELPQ